MCSHRTNFTPVKTSEAQQIITILRETGFLTYVQTYKQLFSVFFTCFMLNFILGDFHWKETHLDPILNCVLFSSWICEVQRAKFKFLIETWVFSYLVVSEFLFEVVRGDFSKSSWISLGRRLDEDEIFNQNWLTAHTFDTVPTKCGSS